MSEIKKRYTVEGKGKRELSKNQEQRTSVPCARFTRSQHFRCVQWGGSKRQGRWAIGNYLMDVRVTPHTVRVNFFFQIFFFFLSPSSLSLSVVSRFPWSGTYQKGLVLIGPREPPLQRATEQNGGGCPQMKFSHSDGGVIPSGQRV